MLFEILSQFCSAPYSSYTYLDSRTNKNYSSLTLRTRSLPLFTEYYKLFYLNGVKVIPNIIGDLLTPLSLAYWIADDGGLCQTSKRLILSTNSFTLEEVNLLASVLNNKWNLNCYVNKIGNGYRILIPKKSLPLVQTLLKDIIPSMMLFKIDL